MLLFPGRVGIGAVVGGGVGAYYPAMDEFNVVQSGVHPDTMGAQFLRVECDVLEGQSGAIV